MSLRRLVVGLIAVACLSGAAGPGPALARLPAAAVSRLGNGASEVWLFRPIGPVRSVVVFGHGWSTPFPAPYMAWIDHLRAGGSLVIYPRYELSAADSESAALVALRQGIVAAFRRIGPLRVPVLAMGKSFAGGAIFDYAADARAWGVPAPKAVLSVFPAIPVGGPPSTPLPPTMDVEILVGDHDTVAGSFGADLLWRWLSAHPSDEKRYVVVRSHPGFLATHSAPQLRSAGAQAAFWRPLDVLVMRARGDPTVTS